MMALAQQVGSGQSCPRQMQFLSLSGSGRHPRIGVEILMLDFLRHPGQEDDMPDSVYKVIELVGTSNDSWEKAAANAVEQAAKSLRDLRIAEVVKLDMQLDDKGKVEAYRAKLNVSFKFEGS
ncbi:dodecin family protein [Bradyrhizobium sp. WSM1253]|uniref:dodecin family protein n=1 Tax=Bradyrhizobium sp. WSM1253 TaxID=319003 RepID=UPI00025D136D|nr:dodecin family protein [Bradyrhizobium sp. WSM1253]EIG57005.1 hypothetical protein Bra1253DRAFT_01647 [Bradyrhizobium sp. WSM1253]